MNCFLEGCILLSSALYLCTIMLYVILDISGEISWEQLTSFGDLTFNNLQFVLEFSGTHLCV